MKYIAILDTETTGLDPKKDSIIEIAVQLYDIQLACPIISYSSLFRGESNASEKINGIPSQALLAGGKHREVWEDVYEYTELAECIVAHRAEFDMSFCPPTLANLVPWVCTKTDVKWPFGKRGDHLVQLALSLGLGVASAHRAMADVDTLSRILTRCHEMGHSLEELFRVAMRPKKRFIALVPFEKKDLAKEAGFLWDAVRKDWYRDMPPEDIGELPFKVRLDYAYERAKASREALASPPVPPTTTPVCDAPATPE